MTLKILGLNFSRSIPILFLEIAMAAKERMGNGNFRIFRRKKGSLSLYKILE
jgi:hypothetical protein